MFTYILLFLIAGYLVYELVEHVILPLIWLFVSKSRQSCCGKEGMLGKTVEVRTWEGEEGRVSVGGELWKAVSSDQLLPGDAALVQKVEGLVLQITALKTDGECPHDVMEAE